MTKCIARISKKTLNAWRGELSDWMLPTTFRERVDEIVHPIPRKVFFGQAGLTFLRDAWIASRVAHALSCDSVRLVSGDRPDFEIRLDGRVQQFEATEADMDERRRGAEPDTPGLQQDPVENWRKRFEAIPGAMDRVITKKMTKEYQPEVSLVIYVNLGCYGAYVEEGLPILRDASAPAKDRFKNIFVLWEGSLYKFWEDGKYAFERQQYARLDDF